MFKVGKTPINWRLVLLNHKNNIYIRKTKLNYMQRIVPPPWTQDIDVHKTFRRCPRRLINLGRVSRGWCLYCY